MFLAFTLVILAFSAVFLYKFLGPEFWDLDPLAPEDDPWEEQKSPHGKS